MNLPESVHRFHIPVMGTGFTVATPLRVARYGIDSVVSIVDDHLIEQTRHRVAASFGRVVEAIGRREEDARAKRIRSYIDMLEGLVHEQVEALRASDFVHGSEITRYFEMLPASPLRDRYDRMRAMVDGPEKIAAQEALRAQIRPGSIDVNIMTKLDRDPATGKIGSGTPMSHAMSALRGFATSCGTGAVVLSAGLNLRLFSYLAEFDDFFPDARGRLRKRIVLKVQDLRSAAIQGKVLAKRGLWISEVRVESGLNCGGHAFGDKGRVLGPILDEFREGRDALAERLAGWTNDALQAAGRMPFPSLPQMRLTVQGGIGTHEEDQMLFDHYRVDGTGWGSPFLTVPEVVSIDPAHLDRILDAGEDDVELSRSSPLGVPFWNLRTSASESDRQSRVDEGRPGIICTKGFLISNFDYAKKGICTASRRFQRRRIEEIENSDAPAAVRADAVQAATEKACLCRNLAGGAEPEDEKGDAVATAVCCGPNTAYFAVKATLRQMVDHIYGRVRLPIASHRPHMFVKELRLHVAELERTVARGRQGLAEVCPDTVAATCRNLIEAIDHYAARALDVAGSQVGSFHEQLNDLRDQIERISDPTATVG